MPAVVEKLTGAELSGLPLMSSAWAVIVDEPPVAGKSVGLALTRTLPTAAVPTRILNALAATTATPPEIAVIVAVPDPRSCQELDDDTAADVGLRL